MAGQAPTVTTADLRAAIVALGLAGRCLCVHSSLRSFGHVAGGSDAVLDALLAEGCTILVPAFTDSYGVPPPPDQRPARNGWDYDRYAGPTGGIGRVYTPESGEIERGLGAIPAAVVARAGRSRGNHPLNSFAALGPRAAWLVATQRPHHVYAPLERLAEAGGWIVLLGVGLTRMTFLHLAEQRAGRNLFLRWANDAAGQPRTAEVGSCADGFDAFDAHLAPLVREITVGASHWRAYPARETLAATVAAIRADPAMTHCGDPECERCNDAVAGGPIGGE